MAIRYAHRRLGPAEFSKLLNDAEFSLDDFLYLTGRRREQAEFFLSGTRTKSSDYTPTMAEVLILELAKRFDDDEVTDAMFNIVRGYDAGPPPKKQKRSDQS